MKAPTTFTDISCHIACFMPCEMCHNKWKRELRWIFVGLRLMMRNENTNVSVRVPQTLREGIKPKNGWLITHLQSAYARNTAEIFMLQGSRYIWSAFVINRINGSRMKNRLRHKKNLFFVLQRYLFTCMMWLIRCNAHIFRWWSTFNICQANTGTLES